MDGGPSFFLLSILLVIQSCCSFTRAQPEFWISEVYSNFTNFTDAFLEISDGGIGSLTLTNISLELEKQNSVSLNISLDQRKTNTKGFLVLSFEDSDTDIKSLLGIIQNETVILKLSDKSNKNSNIIDIFKKEKGWSDVMSCFREESGLNAIVLVGKKPSKGARNNCPLSPVRLDLFMYNTPFDLSVQLVSHGINQFSLINHTIDLFEDDVLLETFHLTNYSTEKKKVNISMDISHKFNVKSSYRIDLEIQINTTLSPVLESLYFGAPSTSAVNLTEVFQTYPDKNPAQSVSPVYLQIVPNKPINFASCHCEVSTSTYNSFVSISSSVDRNEKCQEKCNDLITKSPTASQTTVQITSSSLPDAETTTTADPTTDQSNTNPTRTMDFKSSTAKEDLTTEGLTSTTVPTHSTTENLSTTIAATEEASSSTMDFHKYSTFSSVSEATSTDQKLTSTLPTTTQNTLLSLYFNEIKVGSQLGLDHWIELKGNTSFEMVSSYQLVLNVSGEERGSVFDLKSLGSTDKYGLLYINFSTPGAGQLLKKLHQSAGLLRLFNRGKSTGLADCVAYQIEGSVLEKKLVDLCPFHKLKQVTLRELHENWTIGRCKGQYEVLEPSADQSNKCPSLHFSKPVYMKILKRKLDTNFKTLFLSSLVQKLSADKGCMLSMAFFLHFSANNSADDLHIYAILAAPNQTKLNALYMCFKTLFHKKPVELQLGSDKVIVYRCYNTSFIIPTAAESGTKEFAGKNKTLAIAITLLVLFVCLVAGCCIYMRYKRRSLFEVLGMAHYNADQDDLLVNMEDVGRLDTNFRNPTYSQLSAY